ncbi:MAG: hypothetical protein HYZ22_07040 [Chloroflexi bacterium]|nr:hypothetical protein [Chloroflexota bacterium]
MFFGNKEESETSKPPIHVTVVTDEYIIDAWDDPELSILQAAYDSEVSDLSGGNMVLKDAYVKPLGNINTPARTFPNWRIASFAKIIAIVSDDPAAEDLIVEGWTDYEHPFKALMYAGAFTVEGRIYSDDEDPPAFDIRTFAPLEDATITYQLDKNVAVIRGRWGVVNSVLMHGFTLEN